MNGGQFIPLVAFIAFAVGYWCHSLRTPRKWAIIEQHNVTGKGWNGNEGIIGTLYILQDQNGRIKRQMVST